jgi:hypothetical protein
MLTLAKPTEYDLTEETKKTSEWKAPGISSIEWPPLADVKKKFQS